MTVLFSIGEGHDDLNLVPLLLTVDEKEGKPGYKLASPDPLLLTHCEYWPPVFTQVEPRHNPTAPGTVYTRLYEAAMIDAWQIRVSLSLVQADGVRLSRSEGRPIMKNQKSMTLDKKVENLKGSKKKRYDNVQVWKEDIINREGQLRGRSRSRSREKRAANHEIDEKRTANDVIDENH